MKEEKEEQKGEKKKSVDSEGIFREQLLLLLPFTRHVTLMPSVNERMDFEFRRIFSSSSSFSFHFPYLYRLSRSSGQKL